MTDRIIKYRWLIIIVCLTFGLFFGLLIPFSETDPEIRNYIPDNMKSRIETDSIESEFGVQDMVMILFNDSSVVTYENLKRIREIDRGLSKLSGISRRVSPFTVQSIKSTEGMMTVDPLIKRIPESLDGLKQLESDLMANRFARDIVISSDLTSAAITATINNSESEKIILQKIDSVVNSIPGEAKVYTAGLPYIRRHILRDVRKDGIILVPLALLIMLLVLKFTLGRWKYVIMPFSVIILSTAACMGLIPLFGWKLSIITLLVPIILIAVANNYGIYLVARFRDFTLTDQFEDQSSLIHRLSGSLNMPILFSGLTTIAGIAGLLTHSIIPARQVGVLAAIGVASALIMSLSFIPALLYSVKRKPEKKNNLNSGSLWFERVLSILSGFILKKSGRIVLVFCILTILIAAGSVFLRIETNQEKYFPKSNPVRYASELINKKFGGSQTISVMVSGDIFDHDVMKGIDSLCSDVKKIEGVGSVFAI